MIQMTTRRFSSHLKIFVATLFCALALSSVNAHAQEQAVDILPEATNTVESTENTIDETTHPPLRLTPDKSELIRLDTDAKSVIVGNALHLNLIADSARTLVAVPRTPGATHFTVLDENGEIIMQRHVIVASPKKNYIRIKRACPEDSDGCQSTSVYYCPDMCHEIGLPTSETNTSEEGDSGAEGNSTKQAADSASDPNDDNEASQ